MKIVLPPFLADRGANRSLRRETRYDHVGPAFLDTPGKTHNEALAPRSNRLLGAVFALFFINSIELRICALFASHSFRYQIIQYRLPTDESSISKQDGLRMSLHELELTVNLLLP